MSNEEYIEMCEAYTNEEFAILCADAERDSMDSFIAEMSAEAELRSSAIDTLIELERNRRQEEEEDPGFSMSPNRANLEQFYPDVTVPMPVWFNLLNEIEDRRQQRDLAVDFACEEFDLPPINWSQEHTEGAEEDAEQEEGEEEEDAEEEEELLCQPIFTAPIPLGDCPICMDPLQMVDFTVTKCGHSFHASCLLRSVEDSSDCPLCRKELTKHKDRTNYDDIEWVEYEGEGTEVDEDEDEDYEEEPGDEEEERGRIPSLENEPHWDAPPVSREAQEQKKREEEEFATFSKAFADRTSHSIFVQAQDTYGEAHECFARSHAFRAAGDHWNGHKYQCHFAKLIEKAHDLMTLTHRPRPDDNATSKYTWQTNRKTTSYLDPSAPAKDFLSAIMKKQQEQQQQPLEIELD